MKIAIIGCGNIGQAIAEGFLKSGEIVPGDLIMTRKNTDLLTGFEKKGCVVSDDNVKAVEESSVVILAIRPKQLPGLMNEIRTSLNEEKHTLVSIVTSVSCEEIKEYAGKEMNVVRVMPNTAIAVGESMTCVASDSKDQDKVDMVKALFELVGTVIEINEEDMIQATVICACGIAFFLRAIRAVSQGGTEIGFHSAEAIEMAAQTAKGAASLLLKHKRHPEEEIDQVTTPRGITITGLNQMEHEGFSSSVIKGIMASARMAEKLTKGNN